MSPQKTPLDCGSSALYNKVACFMKHWIDWPTQPRAGGTRRDGRLPFELAWAAISSPMVAILVVGLLEVLRANATHAGVTPDETGCLFPMMLGGMAVLTAYIYFDCRAKVVIRSCADKVRGTLGVSTALTMIVLAVVATAQGDYSQTSEAAAFVLFLGLPVLFVCGGLLWHAATLIQSSFRRGLMLAGFVLATAFVEWLSTQNVGRNTEERLFMLNSLLVALAFGIHLSVWSARAFCPSERPQ